MDHYSKAFTIPILTAISILFAVVLASTMCSVIIVININHPLQARARHNTFATCSFPLIAVRIGIVNALE